MQTGGHKLNANSLPSVVGMHDDDGTRGAKFRARATEALQVAAPATRRPSAMSVCPAHAPALPCQQLDGDSECLFDTAGAWLPMQGGRELGRTARGAGIPRHSGGERICTERPLTLTVPAGKPVAPRARRRPPPLTAQSSAVQRRADTTRTVQQARGGTSARSASKTAARKGAPSGSAIAAPAGSFDFAPRPVNLCCLRPIPAPSVRQWWRRTGTPRLMKTAKVW